MSVLDRDLRIYGSANMPDGDGATTGGAVDFAKKITFADLSATGTVDIVSDNASDTAVTITTYGRDATGVIVSEALTCNGTTIVTGSTSFERLLKALASGTTAVGNVAALSHTAVVTGTAQAGANAAGTTDASITLQSGHGASCSIGDIVHTTGGTGPNQLAEIKSISGDVAYVDRDWSTVPDATTTYTVNQGFFFQVTPNQVTEVRRPFYNAAADVAGGSNRTYYEKVFAVNDNTATALTVAQIIKETDPSSGTLEFALTNSLNDTATVANRQTAPASGITAFSTGAAPQTINVPSLQNLPPGSAPNAAGAQGIWLSLLLTAGLAPANTFFVQRISGQTT